MENVEEQYAEWYRRGLLDKQMLALAVARGRITAADYTGEDGGVTFRGRDEQKYTE